MSNAYTVSLPNEIDERLSDIARDRNISKGEAMKRAFALLSIAVEEEKKGNYVGIVKPSANGKEEVVTKVTGL